MSFVISTLTVAGLSVVVISSATLTISDRITAMDLMPFQFRRTQIFAQQQAQVLPITAQAQIGSAVIDLEVAQTPQQQALGLMFRTRLGENRGMLFPFPQPRVANFWMKNCKIALDMIFLRDGVVKAIEKNAPPCNIDICPSYSSIVLVDQVIELRGGQAEALGIEIGDRISIQPLSP